MSSAAADPPTPITCVGVRGRAQALWGQLISKAHPSALVVAIVSPLPPLSHAAPRRSPNWLPPSIRSGASVIYLRRIRKWSAPDLDLSGSINNDIAVPSPPHAP